MAVKTTICEVWGDIMVWNPHVDEVLADIIVWNPHEGKVLADIMAEIHMPVKFQLKEALTFTLSLL